MIYDWVRFGGYECSSKGDSRFSAFYARLADGRTIEQHYQCDVKGYDPGGTDWRKGKGKPPLLPSEDLYTEYLALWREWADANPQLIDELLEEADHHDCLLSDGCATTPINQARALSDILNETSYQ